MTVRFAATENLFAKARRHLIVALDERNDAQRKSRVGIVSLRREQMILLVKGLCFAEQLLSFIDAT